MQGLWHTKGRIKTKGYVRVLHVCMYIYIYGVQGHDNACIYISINIYTYRCIYVSLGTPSITSCNRAKCSHNAYPSGNLADFVGLVGYV